MSWLGSGFSQITGQISNFTKEVLTEGTEEIDDVGTELRVAKKTNFELETINAAHRAELDRLRRVNEDLSEKLESAELQINAISNEYRDKLQTKEAEVKHLKQRHNEMLDFQGKIAAAAPTLPHAASMPALQSIDFAFGGDEHDFGDVISSQHEINRLRAEVQRLEAECRHWRQSSTDVQDVRSTPAQQDIADYPEDYNNLQARLKNLDQRLSDELDSHQRELAALQDLHVQKLSALKKKSKDDAAKYEETISELREQISRCDPHHTLLDLDSEDGLARLKSELEQLREENDILKRNDLTRTIELSKLQHELKTAQTEFSHAFNEDKLLLTSTPAKKLPAHTDDSAEEKICALEAQIEQHQAEIQQFEAIRSDLTSEKEQLEEVLMHLRQQLKEKDTLSPVQKQKYARRPKKTKLEGAASGANSDDEDDDMPDYEEQVQLLQEGNTLLEKEVSALKGDKDHLSAEVKTLRERVQELEIEINTRTGTSPTEHMQQMTDLLAQIDTKNATIQKLKTELDEKKALITNINQQLKERDQQIKEISAQALQGGTNLQQQEIARLAHDVDMKNDRIAHLQLQMDIITKQVDERDMNLIEKEAEIAELERRLHGVEEHVHLYSSGMSYDELNFEAELLSETRTKLRDAEDQMGDLHDAIEEKEAEIESMKADKLALEQSLEELDAQQQEAMATMIENRNKLTAACEEHKSKVIELTHTNDQLTARVQELEKAMSLQGSQQQNSSQESNEGVQKAEQELEAVQTQITSLTVARDEAVKSCTEMKVKIESTAHALNELHMDKKELEAQIAQLSCQVNGLQDQLNVAAVEKETLVNECADLKHRLSQTEEAVQQATSGGEGERSQLEMKVHDMSLQLAQARTHSETLEAKMSAIVAEHASVVEELEARLSKQEEEKRTQVDSLQTQRRSLEREMAQMESRHSQQVKQYESYISNLSKTRENDETSIQVDLDHLRKENHEKNRKISELEETIENLEQQVQEQTSLVQQYSQTLKTHETTVQALQQQVTQKESLLTDTSRKLQQSQLKQTDSNKHIQNGDVIHEHSTIEVDKLRDTLSQKDDVISELRTNNASLFKMLEDRSLSIHGDQTLVKLHQVENSIRNLQREKEQIMSVLNEKSRECSSLKSEVHKLMNVVSQEKAALTKLQQENAELMKQPMQEPKSSTDDPGGEMTKEAVKNLSRIIRDKDLEIESLNQKAQSLLQVLQQSSTEGAQLSALMAERDNLMKQLGLFQADREQIIAALNQKHAESVAYHNEVQRVSALHLEDKEQLEKLQQDYTNLKSQYESKQQTLLKVQNELVNVRQKYQEVDLKYRDALYKQKHQSQVLLNESQQTAAAGGPEVSVDGSGAVNGEAHMENSAINEEILEGLRLVIVERDQDIKAKDLELEQKDNVIKERENALREKEATIGDLTVQLRRAEEMTRHKDSELATLKKQLENVSFQLAGLQSEVQDLQAKKTQLTERAEFLQAEMTQLKDANVRLTRTVGERDLETSMLKEKVSTLTSIMSERGSEEKGEAEQLLAETEAMKKQAALFQAERDQAMASLQAKQADYNNLNMQLEAARDHEHRLERELERLRGHLLAIEDGYTQEALKAEEREKDLRNRLATAEERAMSSSTAIQNANDAASQQVDSLKQQLMALAAQRDSAVLQYQALQETTQQYASSLTNLQMVLEQFQQERVIEQSAERDKYQKLLDEAEQDKSNMQQQLQHLQAQLEQTTEALEGAQRISEQLDRKEEAIAALKEEVQLRETALKHAEEDLHKLKSSSEVMVEKALMKSLFMGYFHTGGNKRSEVLRIISKVLDLTPEETEEMGLTQSTTGWLTSMFRRGATVPTPPSTPSHRRNPSASSFDKSFSELFVKFLERESSPEPKPLRLPAEQMAREQQEKHDRQKAAFNPFSAPAQVSSMPPSLAASTSVNDPHLLMKPIAPSLPVFSPVLTSATGARSNQSNSGRSTPASSTAILKDVLQQ